MTSGVFTPLLAFNRPATVTLQSTNRSCFLATAKESAVQRENETICMYMPYLLVYPCDHFFVFSANCFFAQLIITNKTFLLTQCLANMNNPYYILQIIWCMHTQSGARVMPSGLWPLCFFHGNLLAVKQATAPHTISMRMFPSSNSLAAQLRSFCPEISNVTN